MSNFEALIEELVKTGQIKVVVNAPTGKGQLLIMDPAVVDEVTEDDLKKLWNKGDKA